MQLQSKVEKVLANLPINANLSVLGLPPEQLALHLIEIDRKLGRHFAMGKGNDAHLSMARWGFIAEGVDIRSLEAAFNSTGFAEERPIAQSPESTGKSKSKSGSPSRNMGELLTPAVLVTLGLDQVATGATSTQYMSATGRSLPHDDQPIQRSLSRLTLVSRADNYRMQHLLWSYLSAVFDMRQVTDLCETFFAVDALQQLLILLTNGVHAARTEIDHALLELGSRICTTGADLAKLQSDFYAYSVLHNIIHALGARHDPEEGVEYHHAPVSPSEASEWSSP